MAAKVLRAIIIGAPGSGKGTISERIVKDFKIKHLSSGDALRNNIAQQTDIGKTAKKFIENGSLVPDNIITSLMISELKKIKEKHWLLDGFPRTINQAEYLQKFEDIDVVLNLDVPFDVIIQRIQGRRIHQSSGRVYHMEFNPPKLKDRDDLTGEPLIQREDDKAETVMARLQSFQRQTEPVLDYYRINNKLQTFTGSYSNEIWPKVHKYLATKIVALQYTDYGKSK